MNPTFQNLPESKKEKIIEVCIDEFGEYGYANASTNRIVEKVGISKGSLFKYFDTKEDLYLYILKVVMSEYFVEMDKLIKVMPKDLFERYCFIVSEALKYFEDMPGRFHLVMSFIDNTNDRIYEKLLAEIYTWGTDLIQNLLSGLDLTLFRLDFQKTFMIIKWLLVGIKMDVINNCGMSSITPDIFRREMLKRMETGFKLLKNGLLVSE